MDLHGKLTVSEQKDIADRMGKLTSMMRLMISGVCDYETDLTQNDRFVMVSLLRTLTEEYLRYDTLVRFSDCDAVPED